MSVLGVPASAQDHVAGNLAAPVVLVEYGDYQCTACGEAFSLVKRLQQRFGSSLCVVFRHFPLQLSHPQAWAAAVTAEYAGTYGRFWQAHDALYSAQPQLGEEFYRELARELGLSEEGLVAAQEDPAFRQRIQADIDSGMRSGVTGTPSFLINDRVFLPRQHFEELYEAILAVGGKKL